MEQRAYERPSIESSETVEAHLAFLFPDRHHGGGGNVGS